MTFRHWPVDKLEKCLIVRGMGIRAELKEIVEQLPEDRLPEARRALKAVSSVKPSITDGRTLAELAPDLAGCLDGGPPDLSTNPAYMDGFGE